MQHSTTFPLPHPGQPDFTQDPEEFLQADTQIPLGQRLLKAGLLTQSQLAQALREQRQTHLKFGEVCLEHHWIQPEHFYQFTPSHSLCLGEILVAQGYMEFDQLRVALAQQHRYGRKLGEILLWKGWIGEAELKEALQQQRHLQERQFPNAWSALQSLAAIPHPFVTPDPGLPQKLQLPDWEADSVSTPFLTGFNETVDPPRPSEEEILEGPEAEAAEIAPPLSLTQQVLHYRNQAAALELQMELKQREWDLTTEQLRQQIIELQQTYPEQLQQLQEQLQRQAMQQQTAQQTVIQQYQEQISALETALQQCQTELREQHTRTHTQIRELEELLDHERHQYSQELQTLTERYQAHMSSLQARLQEMETKEQSQDQDQAEEEKRAQRYQHQIRALEEEIALQQSQLTAALTQIQELDGRPSAAQQEILQQQEQQIQSLQAEIQDLKSALTTAQQTEQAAQQRLRKQKVEILKAQQAISRLAVELTEIKQQQKHDCETAPQTSIADDLTTALLEPVSAHQDKNPQLQAQQAQELLHAYRQSLSALQQDLKTAQNQNRLLNARLRVAERRGLLTLASASPSISPPVAPSTRWEQHLFDQMLRAGLLTSQQIQQIQQTWNLRGGKLTDVMVELTGIPVETIKFFSESGYSAKLMGCHRMGEYLLAAGLITRTELDRVLQDPARTERLGEALAHQGVISPETADYFAQMFTADKV
ncbi:MAG: hypothetical protein HC921_14410 [Synechococcaceae cyanobacterium SM2_3_1]|nr:hypothetical protein [Synechococcaceae cyanobacterium SM2_3_1]